MAVLSAGWFLVLTLAVALPWFLTPGFLFLLDFVWGPEPRLLLVPIGDVVPLDFLQKLLVALPLLLAGVACAALVSAAGRSWNPQKPGTAPSIIAGTFYAFNPFVQTRLAAGAIYFLLAYAITPLVFWALLRLREVASVPRALGTGLLAALVILLSPHHAVLLGVPLVLLLIAGTIRRAFTLRSAIIVLLPALTIGGWWLMPAMRATTRLSALAPAELAAVYATVAPHSGSLLWDLLALSARWRTSWSFPLTADFLPGYDSLWTTLLVLMAIGAARMLRSPQTRGVAILLAVGLAVTLLAAAGAGSPWTADLTQWMFQTIPGATGFRDTTKFLALTALGESLLLAAGGAALLGALTRRLRPVAAAATFSLVVLLASPAFAGFHSRLRPAPYPASWETARSILEQRPGPERILLLPWSFYVRLPFTGRWPVANPGRVYFPGTVITADNPLHAPAGGRRRTFTADPSHQEFEEFLATLRETPTPGAALRERGIDAVLMLSVDAPDPLTAHLRNTPDLQLGFTSDDILLFWTPEAVSRP